MNKKITKTLLLVVLVVCLSSCISSTGQVDTSNQSKEVLPQHKQEVAAIYKECLEEKHGVMLNCIYKKVQGLEENVEVFEYSGEIQQASQWTAPKEYVERENMITEENIDLEKGAHTFNFYCSGCHGGDGKGEGANPQYGKKMADLVNPRLLERTDGAIFWKITEGGWPMPAFWEGDVLTEEDLWQLIHYLRNLPTSE